MNFNSCRTSMIWKECLLLSLCSCTNHPLVAPNPQIEEWSRLFINMPPDPLEKIDLLFLIDNSRSMAPKQQKLKEQFPKLIEALGTSSTNAQALDLRIAIVTSDLGTGASGRCLPRFGDRGKFFMPRMNPAGLAIDCGVKEGATFLEYRRGKNINFDPNRDISEVFGCIASAVGQSGCGFEQQLEAVNWALNLEDPITGKTQSEGFLRQDAALGIILLTDEDDCSTPMHSLLAAAEGPSTSEAWSLRCATRGHTCGGNVLPYSTSSAMDVDFHSCQARKDFCPDSESGEHPTECSPLSDLKAIANRIKAAKQNDLDQILVAAIMGWPRQDQTNARYKIDRAPQPNSSTELFDYWPVCTDPNHPLPADPSNRQAMREAFEYGAFGGLRIKAFLDEFSPYSTLRFSICEEDFGPAMAKIGASLSIRGHRQICIPKKLQDTDPIVPGVQLNCRLEQEIREGEFAGQKSSIPQCNGSKSNLPCWEIQSDSLKCPAKLQSRIPIVPSQNLIIHRSEPFEFFALGTFTCRTCPELSEIDEGLYSIPGCSHESVRPQ